ncbi:MAG TPA: hypothetical protein VGR07_13240, partial [Thermoanaerobaculia bacterium]|nr:hypothetical protein [Thermoanaerobaculia bacterium]
LAQRLVQNLRLLAPKAQLPEIPDPRGGRRATPPPPPPPPVASTPAAATPPAPPPPPQVPPGPGFASRAAGFFSGLGSLTGKRRTQVIVGSAAALALVIVIIVVATSGGGGGGSNCAPVNPASAQQAGIPTMKLSAVGTFANAGCPPSGQITLGSTQPSSSQGKTQSPTFALQANAVHLPPTGSGERYLLWLYKSDTQSVPLGQQSVDSSGNLTGAVPVPGQELVLIPAFQTVRFARVTSAQAQQIQQSLQAQGKKPTLLVPFVGETVLQGNVADLGIQQLLQRAQSQAGSTGAQGQTTPQGQTTTQGQKH